MNSIYIGIEETSKGKWIEINTDKSLEDIEKEISNFTANDDWEIVDYDFCTSNSKPSIEEIILFTEIEENTDVPIDVIIQYSYDLNDMDALAKSIEDDCVCYGTYYVMDYYEEQAWEHFEMLNIKNTFIRNYFDYKSCARDLRHDYSEYESRENGQTYIFLNH